MATPLNGFEGRTYRYNMAADLWPVSLLIAQSGTPAAAALVTRPALSEWPEKRVGSNPTAAALFLITRATESGETPDQSGSKGDQCDNNRTGITRSQRSKIKQYLTQS